jgi:hypothetical protein
MFFLRSMRKILNDLAIQEFLCVLIVIIKNSSQEIEKKNGESHIVNFELIYWQNKT